MPLQRFKTLAHAPEVELTNTPQRISSEHLRVNSVLIQASKDNAGRILVGGEDLTQDNGVELDPGDALPLAGDAGQTGYTNEVDLYDLFIQGEAGDTIRVLLMGYER